MTKKQVLTKTIAMWRWLKPRPFTEKSEYLLRLEPGVIPRNECYLCERYNPCSTVCPLYLFAGPCELFVFHPYTLWQRGDARCQSEAADAIVLLCEQALEEEFRLEMKKEKEDAEKITTIEAAV